MHGDRAAFARWIDAQEQALVEAIRIYGDPAAANLDHQILSSLEAAIATADIAWQNALSTYQSSDQQFDNEPADNVLVFVGLHDRIALRILMEMMRPQVTTSFGRIEAEQLDPVSARWIAAVFHATVDQLEAEQYLYTRLLRDRLDFAIGDQRDRMFAALLETMANIIADLEAAGIPAVDGFTNAMLPGLGAVLHADPCDPDSSLSPAAPGKSVDLDLVDHSTLAGLGISMESLVEQSEQDCDSATNGGAGDAGRADIDDMMGCIGQVFGEEDQPSDYGMCMAAGLGATSTDELSFQSGSNPNECGNPLASGSGNAYEPFDLSKWYREKFIEPERQKGESPIAPLPEDEDRKRREEINAQHDDAKTVSLEVGLIVKAVSYIVKAVKTIVKWVSSLFSSSDSSADATDANPTDASGSDTDPDTNDDTDAADNSDANQDNDDENDSTNNSQSGTTMPGPDGMGGGGCMGEVAEVAQACLDRMLARIPGYRGTSDLDREPGEIDPRVAYIWEGSEQEFNDGVQACGGLPAPSASVGCEQLTSPPTACPDANVSAAAQYFAEQAARDLFCARAYCAPDAPCECTDELPSSAPQQPDNPFGPINPLEVKEAETKPVGSIGLTNPVKLPGDNGDGLADTAPWMKR